MTEFAGSLVDLPSLPLHYTPFFPSCQVLSHFFFGCRPGVPFAGPCGGVVAPAGLRALPCCLRLARFAPAAAWVVLVTSDAAQKARRSARLLRPQLAARARAMLASAVAPGQRAPALTKLMFCMAKLRIIFHFVENSQDSPTKQEFCIIGGTTPPATSEKCLFRQARYARCALISPFHRFYLAPILPHSHRFVKPQNTRHLPGYRHHVTPQERLVGVCIGRPVGQRV